MRAEGVEVLDVNALLAEVLDIPRGAQMGAGPPNHRQ